MSYSVSAARRTTAPLVIALAGGSNVLGNATGAPWKTLPANVTYWSTKTGVLVNRTALGWATDPGIGLGMIDEIVNVLGYSGPITLVEHGVNGSAYATWQTATTGFAAELIAHCATAGVKPGVVVDYLGSVDAKTPALAAAISTNIQTTADRYRTAWGQATAMIICGCHIPETGVDSDLNLTDAGMAAFAVKHKGNFAHYLPMRDPAPFGSPYGYSADATATLPIQGGGSDHLTGGFPWNGSSANGTPGGSDTAGRRVARALRAAGIV